MQTSPGTAGSEVIRWRVPARELFPTRESQVEKLVSEGNSPSFLAPVNNTLLLNYPFAKQKRTL
jgi:hypothetical protein